jgi:ankyrin repeat protein
VWPGSPKNINEWTPLLYATAKRHKAVVKLLLTRKDVEVNSVDDDEQTPLLIVAMKGDEAVVKLLLVRSNVEVNSKD